MRTHAVVAIVAAALLPATAGGLLTVPQEDRVRSRLTPASASVSGDGRLVALTSYAPLVPLDSDDLSDVYVVDPDSGRTSLVSDEVNIRAAFPRISENGRFVVFEQSPAQAGPVSVQLVIRDLTDGSVRRVGGLQGSWTGNGTVSSDGTVVVFSSSVTNLTAAPDQNRDARDVYLLHMGSHVVRRASVDDRGIQPISGSSSAPGVSGNGRFVVFTSTADLEPSQRSGSHGDPRSSSEARVYVRDSDLNVIRCITCRTTGAVRSSHSAAISADGRYIAFVSEDSTLAGGDRNNAADVFLHDTQTNTTILVSRSAAGGAANGLSLNPAISSDGRFVAFQSDASDLVCAGRCPPSEEDINLLPDVFVFDRVSGRIERVSSEPMRSWMEESVAPAISGDGNVIVFSSRRPIDEQDVDHDFDLFIWRRTKD